MEFNLEDIIRSIYNKKFRISDHADEESHNDKLTFDDVFASVLDGEIIEIYPEDKPYPSCLVYGRNFKNEPIHSVWAYNKEKEASVLVTVYRPDPARWIDFKRRKK